ncbi:MAG: phosphoribosylaminoimidazolesuccinocarboxamide synthase [Candidatus Altiarchaeota archaeon]
MAGDVITETKLDGLKLYGRGKVRDIYDLGDTLLIVVTDRISAFDSILPNGIPFKGKVLNQLSAYWFEKTSAIVGNHMISIDVKEYPEELQHHADVLEGRSMLVKKTETFPIECVARGYLAGSGWKDYQKTGSVCGIPLPKGLKESSRLPKPIYTPATKAESGHDINISFEESARIIGKEKAEKLMQYTLSIYSMACGHVEPKGIIISDTKFEFGSIDGKIILIDEALTPDSSRFWPAGSYNPGGPQPSFDKQYVRDYLEEIRWDKEPPAPMLPDSVVEETSRKYLEAFKIITGRRM